MSPPPDGTTPAASPGALPPDDMPSAEPSAAGRRVVKHLIGCQHAAIESATRNVWHAVVQVQHWPLLCRVVGKCAGHYISVLTVVLQQAQEGQIAHVQMHIFVGLMYCHVQVRETTEHRAA